MSLSDPQVRALRRRVPSRAVKSRIVDGKELSYIEGWYALAEANRIFGFDGWDRETLETKCFLGREARGSVSAVYTARVRVTVRTSSGVVVRDGHGTGEAFGTSAGEVHDRALKTAETDATKRALATFGKAFGLNLYAGGRALGAARPATKGMGATLTPIAASTGPNSLDVPSSHRDAAMLIVRSLQGGASAQAKGALAAPSPSVENGIEEVPGPPALTPALAFPKLQRVRNKEHLRYVASQPCLLCSATPSDAHHVRFAQPRAMGRKVSDEFTVPLCRAHHRELHHSGNEAAWWHDMGIEPLAIAQDLWAEHQTRHAAGASPNSAPSEAR